MTTRRLDDGGRSARAMLGAWSVIVRAATRPALHHRTPLAVSRKAMDTVARIAQRLPRDTSVVEAELGGVRAWRIDAPGARRGRHLVALHGGGYWYGSRHTHAPAYARLGRLLEATTWLVDYRLAPEHEVPEAVEDAVGAFAALASGGVEGVTVDEVVLTGDSAGGGLALSTACELRDRGLPRPACLSLHSPFVDADPALLPTRPVDAVLHPSNMVRHQQLVLRPGDDPRAPWHSPLYRDLAGLPPTVVQWGAGEGLHEDAERLVAVLDEAGVDVTAEAYEGVWHDAFLHVPGLPQSDAWLRRCARSAQRHLRS